MCLPKLFKPFDGYYSSDGEEMIVEDQNDLNIVADSDNESSSDSSNGIQQNIMHTISLKFNNTHKYYLCNM